MRILVINVEVPFPPIGGGPLRTYHLLRALSSAHKVTLIGFTYETARQPPGFPVRVIEVPWKSPPLYEAMESDDDTIADRAFEMLNEKHEHPWFASYFGSTAMRDTIRKQAREGYDLVIIEDADMGQFADEIPAGVRKFLDLHNVYSLAAIRGAERASAGQRSGATREAERTRNFETQVAAQCDLCLVCSESEANAARKLLGARRTAVVPNGVDTDFFRPGENAKVTPGYLLFTGTMSYPPNVEAACHFAADIFPLIKAEVPHATFHVVGKTPAPDVRRLASDSIVIHGGVPDMRPYFAAAEVFVAPLRSGGGTRLKLLEAAASGNAMVSTSFGAEGLCLCPGRDFLAADSAADFAAAVVELSRNPAERHRLGRCARLASEQYDWKKIEARFLEIVSNYPAVAIT